MKYVIFFLLLVPLCATAQWRWLGYGNPDGTGGMGPSPLAFGSYEHHFYVSMSDDGVLRQDTPVNWVHADTGLPAPGTGGITSFASLGRYFYAGIDNGNPSYISSDGDHWSLNFSGNVCSNGNYIFAVADGIYQSKDSGTTWSKVADPPVNHFAADGSCILASQNVGQFYHATYRSTDSGNTWSRIWPDSLFSITAFAVIGTHMFAGGADSTLDSVMYKGLWRSDDSGLNWSLNSLDNRSVNALAASDSFLFAGTDSGIYVSSDLGVSWRNVTDNIKAHTGFKPDVKLLAVVDTLLYAAVNQSGNYDVWRCITDRPIAEMTSNEAVIALPQPSDTIAIFPNPASDMVNVTSGGASILSIRVLNVLGTEVQNLPKANESSITLDLSKLPSGTYFLEIETAKGLVLRKIIRE